MNPPLTHPHSLDLPGTGMSPGSIRLPINAIPPVIGKLRHAYPLSILSVNDAYLPWFHSNFIQLFWPRARGFPHATLDFFYPPQYPSLPLLDTQLFDRRILGRGAGALGEFLVSCLADRLYVQLYVDEFHLPGRAAYRRGYMPHRLLLFGCDRGGASFDILGFTAHGRYAASQVSGSELEDAVGSPRLLADIEATQAGEREIALGDLGKISLTRYKNGRACSFDLQLVIDQLSDYLNCHRTADRFRMLDLSYYDQEATGMEVYSCIRRRLEYSRKHPEFADVLSVHILWEHKKCMLARIEYMEALRLLDPGDALGEAYAEIVAQAGILRMMMLRYGMSRDEHLIERMIGRLVSVMEREGDLLTRGLEQLLGRSQVGQCHVG